MSRIGYLSPVCDLDMTVPRHGYEEGNTFQLVDFVGNIDVLVERFSLEVCCLMHPYDL